MCVLGLVYVVAISNGPRCVKNFTARKCLFDQEVRNRVKGRFCEDGDAIVWSHKCTCSIL